MQYSGQYTSYPQNDLTANWFVREKSSNRRFFALDLSRCRKIGVLLMESDEIVQ